MSYRSIGEAHNECSRISEFSNVRSLNLVEYGKSFECLAVLWPYAHSHAFL